MKLERTSLSVTGMSKECINTIAFQTIGSQIEEFLKFAFITYILIQQTVLLHNMNGNDGNQCLSRAMHRILGGTVINAVIQSTQQKYL